MRPSLSASEMLAGQRNQGGMVGVNQTSVAHGSRDRFRALLDAAPDAFLVVDPAGLIGFANVRAEQLFGYEPEALIGASVDMLVPEHVRRTHADHRAEFRREPRVRPMGTDLELRARRRDGTEFPVEVSLAPWESDEGVSVIAVVRDVSARVRVERGLRLLTRITRAIGEAEDLHSAFELVLRMVSEETGWVLGEAWVPIDGTEVLQCHPAWYATEPGLEHLREESEKLVFAPGVGLPGAVWVSKTAKWVPDVALDPNFSRSGVAAEVGLHAALSIPVLADDEVVAVIEFFLRSPREEDPMLVDVITVVAAQLGSVIRRKRTDEALRRREAIVEAVAYTARRFLNAGSWEEALPDVLEHLGLATGVQRVDVFRNRFDDEGTAWTSLAAGWTSPDFAPTSGPASLGEVGYRAMGFDRWEQTLSRGDVIRGHVRELPQIEREVLTRLGTRSLVIVPVFAGEEWWGNLGFHAAGDEREWTQAEVDALRAAADTLGTALLRGRAASELADTVASLRNVDAQRRRLLRGLVAAQEEERTRIASDIHDDSIQVMTAASLRLQTLRRGLEDQEQLEKMERLISTVNGAIARLRHLLFELRPPALDEEGLAAALQTLLVDAAADAGFEFHIEDRLSREPRSEQRVILFRLAQEAITNARKHSRASRLEIILAERDEGTALTIRDDGVGFARADAEPAVGHLGMTSMRERADMAGGICRITSAPGAGTTVDVWLPADGGSGDPPSAQPG